MKKVYKYICILVIAFLLCNTRYVMATDTSETMQGLELNRIIAELNKYTEELDLESMSDSLLAGEGIEYDTVIAKIFAVIKEALVPSVKELLLILSFVVILGIVKTLELDKDSTISKVANMVTVLVIIIYLLSVYSQYVALARTVISTQSAIMQLVSPFLMSLLILTGAVNTVGVLQPAVLFIVQLISFSVNQIVIPLITVSIVFGIITSMSDRINFEKLAAMCNKTALWINAIFLSIFLGGTSLGVTLSTSVDDITVKAAQTAVSGVIPVVGKFVSESLELVMGTTEVIAKTTGVISVIVLVIVVIRPLIKIAVTVLGLEFVIAVSESIGTDKGTITLLEKFSVAFKTMLGVTISTSVTFVISIGIMMNLAQKIIE